MIAVMILSSVLLLSFILTAALRHFAIKQSLLDVPNDRSSHTVATPRGGGLAFVVVFLLALPALAFYQSISWQLALALVIPGVSVAAIGFADDMRDVPAVWRLLLHFIAATTGVIGLGGLPAIPLFGQLIDLGLFGDVLAVIYVVWLINLYNFMDGIDGLASLEAISVCVAAALLFYWLGDLHYALLLGVLAATVLGFLMWNFPKAKIFMGDAGSSFLGLMMGLLSLLAVHQSASLLWAWLILLAVFIVDASVTLLRRIAQGLPFYQAHRSHAYQYAARKHGSHSIVSIAVLLINVLLMWPLAYFATFYTNGLLMVLVSYVPLLVLALFYRAGLPES